MTWHFKFKADRQQLRGYNSSYNLKGLETTSIQRQIPKLDQRWIYIVFGCDGGNINRTSAQHVTLESLDVVPPLDLGRQGRE